MARCVDTVCNYCRQYGAPEQQQTVDVDVKDVDLPEIKLPSEEDPVFPISRDEPGILDVAPDQDPVYVFTCKGCCGFKFCVVPWETFCEECCEQQADDLARGIDQLWADPSP